MRCRYVGIVVSAPLRLHWGATVGVVSVVACSRLAKRAWYEPRIVGDDAVDHINGGDSFRVVQRHVSCTLSFVTPVAAVTDMCLRRRTPSPRRLSLALTTRPTDTRVALAAAKQ